MTHEDAVAAMSKDKNNMRKWYLWHAILFPRYELAYKYLSRRHFIEINPDSLILDRLLELKLLKRENRYVTSTWPEFPCLLQINTTT